MTARRISEIAVFTPDVDTAVAFYEAVLGEQATSRSPGAAHFAIDGVTVFIHQSAEPRTDDHIAVAVPDLDAACAELRAKGVQVRGPAEYPWGICAYIDDPDGRVVELHEPEAITY